MPTNYPTGLDGNAELPNSRGDLTDAPTNHARDHDNIADAVRAIEAELGTNPSATFATLTQRLADITSQLSSEGFTGAMEAEAEQRLFADDALSARVAAVEAWTGESDAGTVAEVAVIKEEAVNPRNPEFGALLDGSAADDGPKVQAALNHAATVVGGYGGECILPGFCGLYETLTVPVHTHLRGIGARGVAGFTHYFNGDLIKLDGSGTGLVNIAVDQGGNFTGTAVSCVVAVGDVVGFVTIEDIVVTDYRTSGTLGFERDLMLDGTNSPNGLRTTSVKDFMAFGSNTSGETIVAKRVVHLFLSATEVFAAPQTSVLTGLKILDSFSEDVHINGFSVFGTLYTEAAGGLTFHGKVRQSPDGGIVCAAGSDNNIFNGDVSRASWTNNGGPNNRRQLPQPVVRVKKTSSAIQSLASGAYVELTWDAEDFDPWGQHSTSSNTTRITITQAGYHRLTATVVFAANATGERLVEFQINGSSWPSGDSRSPDPSGTQETVVTVSTLVKLSVGDYVEVQACQRSGGALNVLDNASISNSGVPSSFAVEHIGVE